MTRALSTILLVTWAGLVGCTSEDGSRCAGPTILPHLSPVIMGDLRLRADAEPADPATSDTAPYEWVLQLLNDCDQPLTISEVCVVADEHNGQKDHPAFSIEGPSPARVAGGAESAVRLTYDPAEVNALDLDQDGAPDPDRVAVVVQSNATNFPTLIVPVCARLVNAGDDYPAYACTSPVTLPPGAVDSTLCDR